MSPVISGGAAASTGIGAVLFSSVLGVNAASIDTGAGGIAGGFNLLEIVMAIRTDGAGATDNPTVILNNDAGANYDRQVLAGANVTASAVTALAGNNWTLTVHGNGGSASYAGAVSILIPFYAATTFFKAGHMIESTPDATAGNNSERLTALGYRSATAISRFKITAPGNLLAGSSVCIYGR